MNVRFMMRKLGSCDMYAVYSINVLVQTYMVGAVVGNEHANEGAMV